MTEKKKLKKRVRARMEETGERYTEAHAAIKGTETLDQVIDRVFKAREEGALEVVRELQKFHDNHWQGYGSGQLREWKAQMGSEALEYVYPEEGGSPDRERLKTLLSGWKASGTDATVVPPSQEHKHAAKSLWASVPNGSGLLDMAPTKSRDDDDAWYDGSFVFKQLGPEVLEGMTDDQVLMGMWEYAPDVSRDFGMFGRRTYQWDQKTPSPIKQGGGVLVPGPTGKFLVTNHWDKPEVVHKKLAKARADLEQDPHNEIQRLREKLKLAGIDPDD